MPDTPERMIDQQHPSRLRPAAEIFRFDAERHRSSTDFCSPLWSAAQLKNEKNTAAAASRPMKAAAIRRSSALSLLER